MNLSINDFPAKGYCKVYNTEDYAKLLTFLFNKNYHWYPNDRSFQFMDRVPLTVLWEIRHGMNLISIDVIDADNQGYVEFSNQE